MTPAEWHEHAARCREVARTMEDATARRVLLEAAEDYAAMATREAVVTKLQIPTYQAADANKVACMTPQALKASSRQSPSINSSNLRPSM